MPDGRSPLSRQIRAWLAVRSLGEIPVTPPKVKPPGLPDASRVEVRTVPRLQGSIERLAVAERLGGAVPALASLMSIMNRDEAEKIYNFLIGLIVPERYDETVTDLWFRQCHSLRSFLMPEGVTGYFSLLEKYSPESFGLSIEDTLSCWLKSLRSAGMSSSSNADIPLEVAARFPDRFGFVCLRISSGGIDLINAVNRFFKRTEEEKIKGDLAALLLDYTIETGWLLEETDFNQIWNLIKRRSKLVHGRLSGGLVPVSSIRFLAGVIRGIESKMDLNEFYASERTSKAMELFSTQNREGIEANLNTNPELCRCIDDLLEMDLVIEVVSHGIAGRENSRMGEAIVDFLDKTPGGISPGKIIRFLKAIGEEVNGEVIQFLARLIEDTARENRLSPSNTIRFSKITAGILPVSTSTDRTALKAFYRSLLEMKHSEARLALIQLDKAAFHSGVPLSSVLSASSLLIRAAQPDQVRGYLMRIASTARLVEALSPMDRKKTLSGLAPPWVEVILSFPAEVEKTIIDFIKKIGDVTVRCRYLENVVTRLLQEVYPDDPVFRECLAFAVTGYNSAGDIEKLRETEHRVFQKALRAGGRIKAVDKVITDLLTIPGVEGNRSEELINGIRLICDRFSRTAVWEEGADSLFARFLETGVSNILRVFVDNPQTLETMSSAIIGELTERLMPGETAPAYPGVTGTGVIANTFFGSILPDCIALFSRDTTLLVPFLFRLADEITRSIGGMTGDSEFADYLVEKLDQEIIQDRVTVLDSWLSQKTPPPLIMEENWPELRREEWVRRKSHFDSTRMKLFGAVSALVGASGADIKDTILNLAGFLIMEMRAAKIQGTESLSLSWNRTMMEDLISCSQEVAPYTLFAAQRAGAHPSAETLSYLERLEGFMAQDVYHGWRQAALPPVLNCAVEIVIVSKNSMEKAMSLARAATAAIEFLGYSDAESYLSTLKQSLYNHSGAQDPLDLVEKNFLLPLWKRNSAERLDLLMLGMKKSRLLMDILLERLAIESDVAEKISFMTSYSTFFISVESSLLQIDSDPVRSKIAEALTDLWIFSGTGKNDLSLVEGITEAADSVKDVFRRVRYGSGIVSSREAGEISADMRRKYRDNADSVAIILRWTVDPAREGLLRMLEESQTLLQAAGSDSELMRLLDYHGADRGFVVEALPFAENPRELKEYLKKRVLESAGG